MDYSFLQQPVMPGQTAMHPGYSPMPQPIPYMAPPPTIPTMQSYGFTVVPDEVDPSASTMLVPTANMLPEAAPAKKRGRPKKSDVINPLDIIKSDTAEVVEDATINTYGQTSMMLEEAIQQLDLVASELKEEFNIARANRGMRNRTMVIRDLSEAIGELLSSKIRAISELNSTISKSNDLDYKKQKDARMMDANQASDDKYIMDLYTGFIRNKGNSAITPNLVMPTPMQAAAPSVDGTAIIRSPIISANQQPSGNEPVDIGYLNYLARLTPEQNAMFYENDPNVQTVVVYDRATEKKFFQVMNIATGQVVPNVPVLDQRFMDDTYLDMKTMTARNSNLNQSYPIIEINKSAGMSVESQY